MNIDNLKTSQKRKSSSGAGEDNDKIKFSKTNFGCTCGLLRAVSCQLSAPLVV
jgi:hypothetical protein